MIGGVEAGTVVMLPSATFPETELRKIVAIPFYEERLLCTTLFLGDPRLRVVYVTSEPVDSAILDYYLGFTADPTSARSRLQLHSLGDGSPRALTAKLLEHPDVIDAMAAAVDDRNDAYLVPFNVTPLEAEVADRLGIPLFGPTPDRVWLGSKTGSRQVARQAGVAVLDGAEELRSVDEVESAIVSLRDRNRGAEAVVIKLNNGFSGQGNAIVELATLVSPLPSSMTTFCADDESWESFGPKINAEGAIVEQLLRHTAAVSPSAQLLIAPNGEHQVLSTHDQILGGPDNQVYLGCHYPARADYRAAIQSAAEAVARVLSANGVIGYFGVDFVVVPDDESPHVYLSEINLRMGGTTHPFLMASLVTGGDSPFSYVATDNLKSAHLVGRAPGDVIEDVARAGLAFDPSTGTGATLHLLGALRYYGKMGLVCIGRSMDEADDLCREVTGLLTGL